MIHILPWSAGVASVTVAVIAVLDVAARGRSATFRHALWSVGLASLLATPVVLAVVVADAAPTTTAPVPSWTQVDTPPAFPWLVLGWAVPAALLALSAVAGWVLAARLARRAAPLPPSAWHADAEASARRLGLSRPPLLVVSDAVRTPAVVGVFRPVLLLPPQVVTATAAYRQAILDHELAHIVRRDVLATRLSSLGRALHWYNPLVWWAVARLDLAAECACDDAVLRGGLSSTEYAGILAHAVGRPPSPAYAAGFGTAPIVKRVEALAAREHIRRSVAPPERWALAAAMVLALMPLAAASATLAGRPAAAEVIVLPEGASFTFSEGAPGPGPATTP
jgi:beta-lactamase regulating signal transducer with metallopeptidase domain